MHNLANFPSLSKDDYQIKILLHRPRFQKEILILRSKWNIPDEGFTIQRKYDEWKNGMIKVDNAKYETEVSNIRNKLGLASRWQEPIKKYVEMNTPLVFKAKPPEAKQVEYDLEGNVELVWLKVDQDTQQREVVAAFNDAKGLFRLSDKKQRPDPKKLERDLEVFIRRNEGETYRQITEWLNDTYDEVYNTEDAKRIFKRIKRKLD